MSTRVKGAGLLRDTTCLERYKQSCTHGYADQQLERDV